MPDNEVVQGLDLDEYKYGFVDEEKHVFRTQPGRQSIDYALLSTGSKCHMPSGRLQSRLQLLAYFNHVRTY